MEDNLEHQRVTESLRIVSDEDFGWKIASPDGSSALDSSDSSSESEDVEEQIEFLRCKQELLRVASELLHREESYDAANVKVDLKSPGGGNEALWAEAKEYLHRKRRSSAKAKTVQKRAKHDIIESPKDPKIDLRGVARSSTIPVDSYDPPGKVVEDREHRWVSQVFGPMRTSRYQGLEGYELFNVKDLISISEATSLSKTPRVVVQIAPVFRVVFCNKAFLQCSNLNSFSGKTLEDLLDIQYEDGRLQGRIVSTNKLCDVQAVAVADRARRPLMTHILISLSEATSHGPRQVLVGTVG